MRKGTASLILICFLLSFCTQSCKLEEVASVVSPPVAAFSVDPTECFAPCEVVITNTSTGDINSFAWNFGDGTPPGTQSTNSFSYTYSAPGDYTISLVLTGPGGKDEAADVTVRVLSTSYDLERSGWEATQDAILEEEYVLQVKINSTNPTEQLSGKLIEFKMDAGGGKVNGGPQITVPTNSNGSAAVTWTLGTELFQENRVSAIFQGANDVTIDFSLVPDHFEDVRDGQVYKAVKIGDQIWMAENLNYGTMITSGSPEQLPGVQRICYDNNAANCEIYGGLYDSNDLGSTCPNGWSVPSDNDWQVLEIEAGMSVGDATGDRWRGQTAGDRLKDATFCSDQQLGYCNELNFGILLASATTVRSSGIGFGSYGALGSLGVYWSDDKQIRVFRKSDGKIYRMFPGLEFQPSDASLIGCVRCIKD